MTPVTVIQVDPESAEFSRVLGLHRSAKRTLGFLSDSGFGERAARGTLAAAVRDGEVVGYVLYDLVADRVKLRHLCALPEARGTGVARSLVNMLQERHADRRSIELACRRDYGLADMWKAFGFRPFNNRPGRSQSGHLLTEWVFDFGHPTLFDSELSVGESACLDQMVLEDLVLERPEGMHSRHLLDDWVQDMIELCVTDEAFVESNDATSDALRETLLEAAKQHRNLSRPHAPWKTHLDELATAAPLAGDADHRHVARAIEGGAEYFVTRDERLLAGATAIGSAFPISVLAPEQLLDRLDRQRSQDPYAPVALRGTELIEQRLEACDQTEFVTALLSHGHGERASNLRAVLRRALADKQESEVRVIKNRNGALLAGVVRTLSSDGLVVPAIRVGRHGALTDAIARQLVFSQRELAANANLAQVVVTDATPSPAVLRALAAEAFIFENNQWRCSVRRGLLDGAAVLSAETSAFDAAFFERRHWPAKVTGAGLSTFMVSIEPSYAEQLLDGGLAATTLFSRGTVLGLSREHVYYRPPGTNRALAGPARVLWYVKGGKPGHPTGHVRAVSHLSEVVTGRPRTLHSRFERLGVWDRSQVEAAARRTGHAMALRLTDTEVLAHPQSLSELRALYEAAGEKFFAPQAPIRVSEHVFRLIYQRSSRYAA